MHKQLKMTKRWKPGAVLIMLGVWFQDWMLPVRCYRTEIKILYTFSPQSRSVMTNRYSELQGYWDTYWEKSAGFIHFFKKQYFLIWYFSLSDPITHCCVSNTLANVLRGVATRCSGSGSFWQAPHRCVPQPVAQLYLTSVYNSTIFVLKVLY